MCGVCVACVWRACMPVCERVSKHARTERECGVCVCGNWHACMPVCERVGKHAWIVLDGNGAGCLIRELYIVVLYIIYI